MIKDGEAHEELMARLQINEGQYGQRSPCASQCQRAFSPRIQAEIERTSCSLIAEPLEAQQNRPDHRAKDQESNYTIQRNELSDQDRCNCRDSERERETPADSFDEGAGSELMQVCEPGRQISGTNQGWDKSRNGEKAFSDLAQSDDGNVRN